MGDERFAAEVDGTMCEPSVAAVKIISSPPSLRPVQFNDDALVIFWSDLLVVSFVGGSHDADWSDGSLSAKCMWLTDCWEGVRCIAVCGRWKNTCSGSPGDGCILADWFEIAVVVIWLVTPAARVLEIVAGRFSVAEIRVRKPDDEECWFLLVSF